MRASRWFWLQRRNLIAQWRILSALQDEEGFSLLALHDRTWVDMHCMVLMLHDLIAYGCVHYDEQTRCYSITEKGQQEREKLLKMLPKVRIPETVEEIRSRQDE